MSGDRKQDAIARLGQVVADVWQTGVEGLELDERERLAVTAAQAGRGDVRIIARLGQVLEVVADVIEGQKVTRVFRVEVGPQALSN